MRAKEHYESLKKIYKHQGQMFQKNENVLIDKLNDYHKELNLSFAEQEAEKEALKLQEQVLKNATTKVVEEMGKSLEKIFK